MATQERGSLYPVKGPPGGVALALDRVEYPLESRQAAPDGTGPMRALRLPRRGTGGGETPAGRNPRRRKPPPEANPPPNSRSGGAARDHRGEQAGERPRRRVEARPPGPGGPGAGARGPEPKRGSAGRPPAGGATGPAPPKGGLGTAAPACGKGPGHTWPGRAAYRRLFAGRWRPANARRKGGAAVPPLWGQTARAPTPPPCPAPMAGPGKRARSGAPERAPDEPASERRGGPERAGADGPDGPRRPDDAGV